MAVDLKSNQNSISEAYKDICDDKTDTDWVVFGYEGKSNVIKVVEKGGGGLEEMADEMNSGKLLYAYCKIIDENTNLPKYVLISWQGEGVPDELKFKCANHIRDLQNYLKCVHVTINARSDDDLDVDAIKLRVAKASGSNYSFHKEQSKPEPAPMPVGSVYKRTRAQQEINIKTRDRFWSQTEVDENQRREEEQKRAQEERSIFEQERKERETKEAVERDRNMQERFRQVQAQKMAEQRAESIDKDAEKERWAAEERESAQLDEGRRRRSESLRKEKAAEAATMASSRPQKASAAKAFFEQKAAENAGLSFEPKKGPPPPRKLHHGFASLSKDEDEERVSNQPLSSPDTEPTSPPSYPAREPSPEPDRWQPEVAPEPEPSQLPASPLTHPEPYTFSESAELTSPSEQPPQTRNLLKESLPRRQASESEEEEGETWEEEPTENISIPAVISPSQPDSVIEQEVQASPEADSGSGVRAIALYDYQAADDTEITFDPDDIIADIDQIDPGWWVGTGLDGVRGMFPANYVEIMN